MIVSHKHRFIFLKTLKTASSSMEIALSKLCGPDDIITPTRGDLDVQRAVSGQNYRIDHPLKPKIPLWRKLLGRKEKYYHPTVGYFEHIPAWRVRAYLGEEIWNSYYKFCFERNPWDRQVSLYFYKTRDITARPSFEAFLRRRQRAYIPNFDIYAIDDGIVVDRVGRYENIAGDFESILSELGLDGQVSLPHANVTKVKPIKSYREVYSATTRQMVAEWYSREIEALGYEF